MKQYSPARLTKPLKRKPGRKRGEGQFEEISWEEAFSLLAERWYFFAQAQHPQNHYYHAIR